VIVEIEESIKYRLQAEIDGVPALIKMMPVLEGDPVVAPVRVESYPSNPSEQLLLQLAQTGAVVVRYVGSKYGSKRVAGSIVVQDRTMSYEVQIFSRSLAARDSGSGIYELLDICALRLIGFLPAGCVDGGELVRDDFVTEVKGAWAYGIVVNFSSQVEMPI
jgi:hypothetical protein